MVVMGLSLVYGFSVGLVVCFLSLSLCQISSLAILVVSIGGADGGGCGSH